MALRRFHNTNQVESKLRPVLILRKASRRFDDWLVCMVSSKLHQAEPGLDEVISPADPEFGLTGLKTASVLRLSRLAVVENAHIVGSLGQIGPVRLDRVRQAVAAWILAG